MLFQGTILLSCGNLINDRVLSDNENSTIINDADDSDDTDGLEGIEFKELSRNFSASGDMRIEKSGQAGYYIAGTVSEETTDNIWFSLIDKNGKLQNEALLRSAYNDRVRRIKVLDADNLVIYADRYYDDGGIDFIIVKVNRSTGIIWDYCFGDETKNRIFDVTDTDDGGTLITGLSYYQLFGVMHYTTFIMKIDRSGRSVWEKEYRSLFSVFMPSEIKKISHGEYLVSGLCLNRITNKFKTFFTRVDSSGDVISSVYINAVGMHSMLIGTSIVSDDIFTGVISLTGGSGTDSFVIAAFDREMNIQSVREFTFPDFNVRGKLIKGNDGGLIVAGMLDNSAGNGLYFLRFSEEGVLRGLSTKYYDEAVYNLTDVYFGTEEYNDGLLYLCRYKNNDYSSSEGKLFLDKIDLSGGLKICRSAVSRYDYWEITDYETGGVELTTGDSSLIERGGTDLTFVLN